jgi:predicted ABC-type ATPase
MASTPRLRMFAGPNGSGKSTLNEVLAPELLGVYLNPDQIEAAIRARGFLDVRAYEVAVDDKAHVWLAEITDGRTIEIKASEIPEWFSAAVLRDATPASPIE